MPDVFAALHSFGFGQRMQVCKACIRETDGYSDAVGEFFDHQSLSRIKRPAAPRGSRQTPAIREREGKHGACRGENGGNPSRHTMEVHTTIAERDSHENLSEVRHVDQLREDSRTTWHGPGSPIFSVHRVHLPSLLTCAIGANASPGSANRHAGWRGRSTKVPAITGFALGLFISGLDQFGLGHSIKDCNQCFAKRMPWLFRFPAGEVADGCLSTTALHSDLRLRQLAVTLDFGNDVFPVHSPIITDFRYLANGFLIPVFRRLS